MERRGTTLLFGALLIGFALVPFGCLHAGTVHYYYTDPNGNVLAEADATGTITASYEYTPYGATVPSMGGNPDGPGFAGHVDDPSTGLVYMKARYYDPAIGRFLSTDPKPLSSGDLDNFDRYAYANSNPIRYTDPDGLYACGSHTDSSSCPQIGKFVKSMNDALKHLRVGSRAYNSLAAVSKHIGTLGDNNGVTLDAASLSKNEVANAPSATLMNIDVKQASSLAAVFQQYNKGVASDDLANAFGASAISHEGQHQLDYLDSKFGYPQTPTQEHTLEMRAYRAEIGVPMGLGISNDLYAPGAAAKDINTNISIEAAASTREWCGYNCSW